MIKKSKPFIIISIFLVMVLFLTNCATVFKGTTTDVNFRSDPTGAEVYVNGNEMGNTPVELKLESKKIYHIEFKKEGYESKTYTITNHIGVNWVILDVLLGLVPVIVDAATGSWYYLDQESINTVLEPR